MTITEQIEQGERLVGGRLKYLLKSQNFKDVSLYLGWGDEKLNEDGTFSPVLMDSPMIKVVGNESTPGDEDDSRTIGITVTLETCQDEGPSIHRKREKSLDSKICEITREETGTRSRWRWSLTRFNAESGAYQSEWVAIISVDDPCFEC